MIRSDETQLTRLAGDGSGAVRSAIWPRSGRIECGGRAGVRGGGRGATNKRVLRLNVFPPRASLNAGSPRVAHVESRLNLMHGHTVLINGGGSRTRTGGSCNVYKGFREYHGGSEPKEGTPTPDPSRGSA